jgi:hypothetical protein
MKPTNSVQVTFHLNNDLHILPGRVEVVFNEATKQHEYAVVVPQEKYQKLLEPLWRIDHPNV